VRYSRATISVSSSAELSEGDGLERARSFAPELIVRRSTGPAPDPA
jgi:hypothetical protein